MASAARTEKLDVRLTPAAKRTIQRAAAIVNKSLSEFVLESALAHADETLPDRVFIGLDAESWAEFQQALDAPPRDLPQLRKLLTEPTDFEISSDNADRQARARA